MKVASPALTPILRSDVQGQILAEVLLNPEQEISVATLTKRVSASFPTVYREVERLVTAGFFVRRRVGRGWLVRANTEHQLYRPVREVVEYAYGPIAVLPKLLARVDGVEEAFVYGSWAARAQGVQGSDPADIDVLLVGRPDRAAVLEAAQAAQARLGREVNIRSVDRELWDAGVNGFVATVKSRPLVPLDIEED